MVLKFAKTWLGFTSVHFKSYELTEDRKEAILKIPFPTEGNRPKKVRSLLGAGVFFAPFIKHYNKIVKNLTDLTKKDFN